MKSLIKLLNDIALLAIVLFIFTGLSINNAQAAGFLNQFSLTYTTNFSATPNQIGLGTWRNGEENFTGAASCLDPIAKYSNGAITLKLVETCGAIGGSVSSTSSGKVSIPLTWGIGYSQGPLQAHIGYGPDLIGKPVVFGAATFPF